MVGLGELAGADRKGRPWYTRRWQIARERELARCARYYEGIRPYISRRQRPPPFDFLPFSLQILHPFFRVPLETSFCRDQGQELFPSRLEWAYTRSARIGFRIVFSEGRIEQNAIAKVSLKPCIIPWWICFVEINGEVHAKLQKNSLRGFVDLSFVLSLFLSVICNASFASPLPSMGDIFRRQKCFWRVSFLLPIVRYFCRTSTCFHFIL